MSILLDDRPLSVLSARYKKFGYVVIEQLAHPSIAASWEMNTRSFPRRRVFVGKDDSVQWEEQSLPPSLAEVEAFARNEDLKSFVCSVTGLGEINDEYTRVWINRYVPGDCVPIHQDADGDTQLLICLQELSEPELGGELFIAGEQITLKTGDAVLFAANRLSHWVSRIGSLKTEETGYSRTMLVARFYGSW